MLGSGHQVRNVYCEISFICRGANIVVLGFTSKKIQKPNRILKKCL